MQRSIASKHLGSLRISSAFTTRVFLQALVQYNELANIWSSNVRLGLLSDANTGLSVVSTTFRGSRVSTPT